MQFVQNNLMLIAVALLSAGMLAWPLIGRRISGVKEVETLEATQLINHRDAVILDVREDKEFVTGHLPNAKHIPLGQLVARLKDVEKFKKKPIVVNCRSGARSATACGILRKNGFEEVYNLKGGINAWQQANMPVEK